MPRPDLEPELRRDLVCANHIAHAAGLVTAFGHISARLPGSDTFVIPTRASPALASRLSEAGRARAQRFRWDVVVEEVEAAYRDAIWWKPL